MLEQKDVSPPAPQRARQPEPIARKLAARTLADQKPDLVLAAPILLAALLQARAALPDAWAAVQCNVPREVIDRINAALLRAGVGQFGEPVAPPRQHPASDLVTLLARVLPYLEWIARHSPANQPPPIIAEVRAAIRRN